VASAALRQRIGIQVRPVDQLVARRAATVGAGVEAPEGLLHGGHLLVQLAEERRHLPGVEPWRRPGM